MYILQLTKVVSCCSHHIKLHLIHEQVRLWKTSCVFLVRRCLLWSSLSRSGPWNTGCLPPTRWSVSPCPSAFSFSPTEDIRLKTKQNKQNDHNRSLFTKCRNNIKYLITNYEVKPPRNLKLLGTKKQNNNNWIQAELEC